ncbi:ubiquitin-like domain-containing protein [Paenibacillus sp.]|uniref:ubiquitin-like domain-containing protein n=1 Tax=Paenibacillus sp. TaxID=58172 RepID=UPI002824EC7D|nr:ubiquitin-like domain-containing protein [Paenibacillus sp.]MDR0270124.1 ubiquitin-like domain-containing protein [Paenibacillus sp.]
MGIFQQEETHDSKNSSMSFALRWKHENLRQISTAAIISIAVTIMVLLLVNTNTRKQVFLVVDGQVKSIQTHKSVLQEVLEEQAISLKPEDQISMSLSGPLQDGDKVVIDRAFPVQLTADGAKENWFTTKDTVGDVLKEKGISLKDTDKVTPALTESIAGQTDIRIVRVNRQVVERQERLPFRVIKTADPSLIAGEVRIVQKGTPGVMVQHIEKVYHDGEMVSMRMVGKEVQTKTLDKVIAVGTKKKPAPAVVQTADVKLAGTVKTNKAANSNNRASKAGVDFSYKKLIQVSTTAYSANEPGIGTRTATGTRVTEGRTIAVDPNVIPLGWWVYIEGVGFRRAEDTGGAIKGNKIDIYYDSVKRANSFGRKSGLKVYVIGPVKPELN